MNAPAVTGLSVARRLLATGSPPWRRLALAVLLGVAGAMATVGILAGSGYVVDRAAFRPGLGAIAGLLAAVEVLAFLRGPLRYGERLFGHDAAFRALARWRVWLYDRLEPLAPAGLQGWRSGDLLARMTDDVDALQDLTLRCLVPVAVTTAAAGLAVAVVGVILPVGGAVLGAALAVALVGSPLLALRTGPARGREAALRGELTAEVVDLLRGAADLVAFGADRDRLEQVDRLDLELMRLARRRAWAAGTGSALVTLCVGAAVVGVLATGIAAVRAGHLDPVMLGVLPLAAVAAFETVPGVPTAALRAAEVAAAGRRLLAVGAVPPPVVDPDNPESPPAGTPEVATRGARLRYRPDLPWALDGVDLTLAPGDRLAVVGSSGAGKTSLVYALLRFWPLDGGTATLDGVPLDRLRQADVRATVVLVDQDAALFSGSIRHNVTLGRPRASDAEVAEAVRRAQLEAWVAGLPDGLDTAVGEDGAQVSVGQRQRIAVARALLARGRVVVLDEPTAGLDHATGADLLAAVRAAAANEGRSVLLVTHRQADLAGFDHVLELDGGRSRTGT